MNFPLTLASLIVAMLASGCASHSATAPDVTPIAVNAHTKASDPSQVKVSDAQGSAVVQKIEFHSGISSATVERLAKDAGCSGDVGAGLLTEPGPVEIYRMQCRDGSVFMARCEFRQCRPFR